MNLRHMLPFLACLSVSAQTVVYQGDRSLQEIVREAEPYSVIICDRNRVQTISQTIVINKPLTIRNLHARLPGKLGKTPILEVASEFVVLEGLHLIGNTETVTQENRAPLIDAHKGNFRIENCLFENSSKDGVMINAKPNAGDLTGIVVRDIIGRGNVRDVVSISGDGKTGGKVRNVYVENIRGYDSRLRGPVEVSDGSENVTVRSVYAENCVYAVDVQDHKSPHEVNRFILIEDIYAKNSKHAIRTANNDHGHSDLTIRNVTAEGCEFSLQVRNTQRVFIDNVRILNPANDSPQVDIRNCKGLIVSNVFLPESYRDMENRLLLKDCTQVKIGDVLTAQPSNPNP